MRCNIDLEGVDFFFIQDGAVNPITGIRYATDEDIKSCVEILKKVDLPNKTIYVKPHNTGTGIHKELQLNEIFPRYKYGIMADEDLVFNKYYIKTLKVLFKQFEEDPKAGMLQTSFKHTGNNFQDENEAHDLEDIVMYGFSHRWEQGFWRESTEKIKPLIKPYFDLIRNIDFNEMYNGQKYPEIRQEASRLYNNAIAEDHVLEVCAEQAGYSGLHTATLRHKTIGREGGYSFRGSRFDGGKFADIELYDVGNVDKYRLLNE